MLVISSSVRVLNWILGATTDLRPAVPLDLVLVEVVASLQHRLFHAAAASDNANDGAAGRRDGLASSRGQADSSLATVIGMANHHAGGSRGTRNAATVGRLLFAHGDHCALRHLGQRQHVADGQLRLGATVHELPSVRALDGHPELLLQLEAVRIMEHNLAERRASARIVDDVPDKALHVASALSVVHGAQLHGALPEPGLRCEDQRLTLTGAEDDTAHGCNWTLRLQRILFEVP
mmetsp:Transcript_41863/g.75693  ORF Transcript_41863/g.75693 Transcript_41863/m.75693 type:complete len:235 (+) Transcript_41863:187-891(+)